MTTKTSFTSGPWVVDSGMVQTKTGIPIAWMDREPGNGTFPVERDQNARLIAAAPELLAALEQVANINIGGDFSRPKEISQALILEIRGLVRKAKGE